MPRAFLQFETFFYRKEGFFKETLISYFAAQLFSLPALRTQATSLTTAEYNVMFVTF